MVANGLIRHLPGSGNTSIVEWSSDCWTESDGEDENADILIRNKKNSLEYFMKKSLITLNKTVKI